MGKVKRLSKGHIDYDEFGCKSHPKLDPCRDSVKDVDCHAPKVGPNHIQNAQRYVQQRLDRIIAHGEERKRR